MYGLGLITSESGSAGWHHWVLGIALHSLVYDFDEWIKKVKLRTFALYCALLRLGLAALTAVPEAVSFNEGPSV